MFIDTVRSHVVAVQGVEIVSKNYVETTGVDDFEYPIVSEPVGQTLLDGMSVQSIAISPEYNRSTDTLEDFYIDEYGETIKFIKHQLISGDISPERIKKAGISLEFGGPTVRDSSSLLPGFEPDIVTDICQYDDEIDGFFDIRSSPVKSNSLGSVHISALPFTDNRDNPILGDTNLRLRAISEISRIVKSDGFIVWECGTKQDYDVLRRFGFTPVSLCVESSIFQKQDSTYTDPGFGVNGVFRRY